jgi:phosphoribosylanthranilate isomerase
VFVKICGLTTADAVAAAVEAGADAIGFVFAESPRRVAPDEAAKLCDHVPDGIVRVAVMRHPSARDWNDVRDRFGPDWLQTDAEDFAALDLGASCVALPVYRDSDATAPARWPTPLLFEGPRSGSGTPADWKKAAAVAHCTDVVLAGGLTPANVTAAIEAVAPWGVDVSSGVESRPGIKDLDKIAEFVARARAVESIR